MNGKLLLAAAALISLLPACIHRPDGVLSDREMTGVIADMEIAEAYTRNSPHGPGTGDSEALVAYVLDKHGVTRAQFDSTMAWYGRNVDSYYDLCENVDKELAKRRRKASGSSAAEEESTDLWPYTRQIVISPRSPSNSLSFSFPTSEVARGSRLRLRMRLHSTAEANALLGVEYEDGSKGYLTKIMNMTNRLDVTLQTDSSRTVNRIFGYMSVNDAASLPLWLDSIYMTPLPFDSLEYHTIHAQRVQ